ncbi:MAG: carbamoyltransferase C-terminal domain-containing protein [Myxococcota bacterium]
MANPLEPRSRRGEVRRQASPTTQAAKQIAGGAVIGWAQGRSEFGPRALGNRSILADPRVGEHKERINAMIKKRESYRPFAPSVLEERVTEFFEVPEGVTEFPFMTTVLNVRPEHRESLAAVTHVDGSSRLQTVAKDSNPLYWQLINAFGELTGVPVLLNTSFNNNAEPIVNSVEDALVCFLTSGLNHLVVGEYLIDKRDGWRDELMDLRVSLPAAARVLASRSWTAEGLQSDYAIAWNYDERRRKTISRAMYHVISRADGQTTAAELAAPLPANSPTLAEELFELWSARMVRLHPQPNEKAKK